jgi:V-type H+-transporting ATPase subunit C
MNEYWLVSVPGDPNPEGAWKKVNRLTSEQNEWSVNSKFQIPDLKVGTLDSLVSLSDDLAKHDALAESVTRKVAQCLADVIDTDKKVWNKN